MKEIYTVALTDLASPPAIIETDTSRSDVVRKRLQQLDSSLTLSTFERGDLLAEAKANSFWSDWRFKSFPEYLKQSGFDISPRQAEYEIQISNVSKQLGIDLVQKSRAKNSKLKVIYELDPNSEVTDSATQEVEPMAAIMVKLVVDAPNRTVKELREIVDKLLGVTKEDDEFTWMNIRLRKDSKEVIMQAVTLIVAQSGSTIDVLTKEERDISIGIAIERLSAEYLSDPNNQVEEFEGDEGDFSDSIEDGDSYDDDSEEESE